jgi:glycosyltransferase involved in cell wall biosynthesis
MSNVPEIALCIVTYERPRSLALVLESIAVQRGVRPEQMEVVVSDDGSKDETQQVVEDFGRRAPFSVRFITHPHLTFQAARCRNAGAAATKAPYLLFLDGDCILPPQHVATHLEHRRRDIVFSGDCGRVEQAISQNVTVDAIRRGDFSTLLPAKERRRLRKLDVKSRMYNFIRHPTKPRSLRSGDFSIWREDFDRVNGFDENFCGWGGEDDDLGWRLRRAGMRLYSLMRWTYSYHLWHPIGVTVPMKPKLAPNARYQWRKGKLICCRNGLVKRSWKDLAVRIVGRAARPEEVKRMIAGRISPRVDRGRPEVEMLFLPGEGEFSGTADCNVLVALENSADVQRLAAQAHLVVRPRILGETHEAKNVLQFPLDQWEDAMEAVA